MREFLRRKIVRVASLIVSVLSALLAFLKWETAYASIPGDVSGQITLFLNLLGTGWLPIVVLFLFSLVLFGLWLGPDRLDAWIKWASAQRASRSARLPTSTKSSKPETGSVEESKPLSHWENRHLLKRALTEAYKEGLQLSQLKISEEKVAPWALRTAKLIKEALGQERAQRFY